MEFPRFEDTSDVTQWLIHECGLAPDGPEVEAWHRMCNLPPDSLQFHWGPGDGLTQPPLNVVTTFFDSCNYLQGAQGGESGLSDVFAKAIRGPHPLRDGWRVLLTHVIATTFIEQVATTHLLGADESE
jgi:hypothetical protein